MPDKMAWQISVPIFRNTVILKQLGIAIGIPFGLLAIILVWTSGDSVYALYALGLVGALLFLTWLFIMVVYRGQYDAEFVVDSQGVLCRTQAKQAKKNWIINALTVVLGLFSGKPTVAGAGMLAQSRQRVFIRWSQVRKAKYQPGRRAILLWGGWAEHIALFCPEEDYLQIEQMVKLHTKHLSR